MLAAWTLCGVGTLFCVAGVYAFYRNVYEENKKVLTPVLLIIAGVVLIGAGTAKYFGLIN